MARSLGRVAFGATYTLPPVLDTRGSRSEQDIDATWNHLDQDTRDMWENVAATVKAEVLRALAEPEVPTRRHTHNGKATHRQIHPREDGTWAVWCELHGKRHTRTVVTTEAEALTWWREHTGNPKGGAWCPQRVLPAARNPFDE